MIDGNGVKVRLFGKSVCMPLNIVKFALQNEIPVYVAYCVKESDEYKIHCQKMDVDTDYEDAVKQIALVIENTVRNYPYQWHVLSAI
jgi:lauroyl/myristoyl acyltransferase